MLKVSQIGKVKMLPSRMQVNDLMLLNILRNALVMLNILKAGRRSLPTEQVVSMLYLYYMHRQTYTSRYVLSSPT